MRLHFKSPAGVLALTISAAAAAQAPPAAQQPAQKVVPATPAQTGAIPATPAQPAGTVPDEPTTGQSAAPGQAQTTPGQSQASPGQASQSTPATTGQTPSQASGQAQAGQLTAATTADVKAGVSVYDQKGGHVGKVESVSAKGAVVSTGTARAVIPVSSFAKGDKGLVMNMTKAELDAQAKKKSPK